jgi:hypothetical protein
MSRKMADGGEAKYYAALYWPLAAKEPLKLTIQLRVDLQRTSPPFRFALDADKKGFLTAPWSDADWNAFVSKVAKDAMEWNNKFWLTPPKNFVKYDQPSGLPGSIWRPNVVCDLDVDWNAKDNPHETIRAINLDKVLRQYLLQHDPAAEMANAVFRDHSRLYSSEMAEDRFNKMESSGSVWMKQNTVAHEVGHLLGEDHIGIIVDTDLCRLARIVQRTDLEDFSPLLSGGTNAQYCYGMDEPMDIASNIMGIGNDFTVDNTSPWTYAISRLLGMPEDQWRAVVQDPGAGALVAAPLF